MGVLPGGTLTLLLADIEGSTRLWETRASEMPDALARLDAAVDELVAQHGGVRPIEQGEGDSFVIAFTLASAAVGCALDLQRVAGQGLLRLRIGLHTGEIQQRGDGLYMGPTINRTARIRDAGHGGQVLVSQTTADLVQDGLPDDCSLVDLGPCRLRDLGRPVHIWQLRHPALPSGFPPLRGLDAGPNNLPVQLTSFIGRTAAVTQLHGMLDVDRAVTLTGAGGCGKTRLALQVAAERLDRYPGGVWLVDFAPVNDTAAIGLLVADAIGAAPTPGQPVAHVIAGTIGDAPTLLVLDNCEHIVTDCAALAESLLRTCGALTVVATSREPLGFAGEVSFRVPSLEAPGREAVAGVESLQQFEAVELFVERARRARTGFVFDDTNAAVIAEICRRLDGIPLAIELAAARVRALTPDQILAGLRDRFRLLTGGTRTAVPRHQTLQASVDWSYALLLQPERLLLHRLSVFAGGFNLEAAETVGSDGELEPHHIFDLLIQLVDKSLLVSDEDATGGRFGMLETVRQYAAARMVDSGEANEVRRRHFDFYFDFVAQRLETTEAYRHRLDPEYDNIRRALQWADDQDEPNLLVRLAARLYGYWAVGRRVGEGHQWLHRAVTRASTDELRGRVLGHYAHIHGMAVSWEEAAPLAEEAVELKRRGGSDRAVVWSLCQLANSLSNIWRFEDAEDALREAIDLAQAAGDMHGQAFAWFQLGRQKTLLDPQASLEALDEADRLAASIGAEYLQHMSKACMAWAWGELRDFRRAIQCIDDGLAGLRAIGDGWFLSFMLAYSAYTKAATGDTAGAIGALGELSALAADMGPAIRESNALGPGLVAMIGGEWRDAITWLEQVDGFNRNVAKFPLIVAQIRAGDTAAAKHSIQEAATSGPARFERGLLLAQAELAFVAGDARAAQQLARQFLVDQSPLVMTPIFEIHVLQLAAAAAADLQEYDEAARLFGAVATQADRVGMSLSTAFGHLADLHVERVRQELDPDRFEQLWSEGNALVWDDVIAYLSRGRGPRRRPRSGWDSLTATERQVVDLVTEGLPNKTIAENLLMSVPTVKSHLTHAYAKVGVTSRAELIAASHEHHPAPGPPS